jgi:hypothetical protein
MGLNLTNSFWHFVQDCAERNARGATFAASALLGYLRRCLLRKRPAREFKSLPTKNKEHPVWDALCFWLMTVILIQNNCIVFKRWKM